MVKILYCPFIYENNRNVPKFDVKLSTIEGGIQAEFTFLEANVEELKPIEELKENEEQPVKVTKVPKCTKTFDILFERDKGHIRDVRISFLLEEYGLVCTDRFKRQMVNEYRYDSFRYNNSEPIMTYSINPDMQEIVILFRTGIDKPTFDGEVEYIEFKFDKNKSFVHHISEASEFVKSRVDRYYEKRKDIIEDVDIYNTVAYLESQVDALTRLVLQLANNDCDEVNLLKEADKYSVLDIKTTDNMIREFEEDKGNARKRQTAFYTTTA